MNLEFKYEIKSLSLTADYSDIYMGDHIKMINDVLTSDITTHHNRESLVHIENDAVVSRSKELYRIKEFMNKNITEVSTESLPYLLFASDILNKLEIPYSINEIRIDLFFKVRLEDIATIYTNQFPNVPIQESMFIQRDDTNCNWATTNFECTFSLSDLENLSFNNTIDCFEIYYASKNDQTGQFNESYNIFYKDNITRVNFNPYVYDMIQNEFDNVFHKLYKIMRKQLLFRASLSSENLGCN